MKMNHMNAGPSGQSGSLEYVKELKSALDRCLLILDYELGNDPNHKGFTPDEFAEILKEKFGAPTPLSTISSQLYKATGVFVTRTKTSNQPVKYCYQILPRGRTYIRKKTSEISGE